MASIQSKIVPVSEVDPEKDVTSIVNNLKVGDQLRLRREVTPTDPNVIGLHVSPDNVLWNPTNDLIGFTDPIVSAKISPLLQRGTTAYCHVTNVIQRPDLPADVVVEIDFPYLADTSYFTDIKQTFGDRIHAAPSTLTDSQRTKLERTREDLRKKQQSTAPALPPIFSPQSFESFFPKPQEKTAADKTNEKAPTGQATTQQRKAFQRSCLMFLVFAIIIITAMCMMYMNSSENHPSQIESLIQMLLIS